MNRRDVHRCWAPAKDPWSRWAKPVLFAALERDEDSPAKDDVAPRSLPPLPDWPQQLVLEVLADAAAPLERNEHPYRAVQLRDTALVIDLPGPQGAVLGVHMAELGFRPVPLYNAIASRAAIVDVQPILDVLVNGAERVSAVPLGAPPAFLLDANRLGEGRPVRVGAFDNRSVCRPSDFPSVETLWDAGIRRAVVIADSSSTDLEPVLLEWQRRGIALWLKRTSDSEPAAPFVVTRRWLLRRLIDEARRSFLRRRSDGSYGAIVEESASS